MRFTDRYSWESLRIEFGAAFDSLCAVTALALNADLCEINIIGTHKQFHLGKYPTLGDRTDPLEDSLCQFVLEDGTTIAVTDCTVEPRYSYAAGVRSGVFSGYLGVPFYFGDEIVGSFCVASKEPREWSMADIQTLKAFAKVIGLNLDHA